MTHWVGFCAPIGLPQNIQKIWIEAVKAVVSDPEIIQKFGNLGLVPGFLEGGKF